MLRIIAAISILMALAACGHHEQCRTTVDEQQRHSYYLECIRLASNGAPGDKQDTPLDIIRQCAGTSYELASTCDGN